MNTSVTRGRGEFVVTGTGMDTEIGQIAGLLASTQADTTPLQKKLDGLSRVIAAIAGTALVLGIPVYQSKRRRMTDPQPAATVP